MQLAQAVGRISAAFAQLGSDNLLNVTVRCEAGVFELRGSGFKASATKNLMVRVRKVDANTIKLGKTINLNRSTGAV